MWFELIGILGTVIVLISISMQNVKLLSCINIVGNVVLVVYGILITSYSTWILNGILIIINIVNLVKLNKK